MAKCLICNSRKGKRKCLVTNGYVCQLCCGETRNSDICHSCSFYKEPSIIRKYNEVPSYTTIQMEANIELQEYSDAIEGAVCAFDQETGYKIDDLIAIRIIELLLDKHYFQDEIIKFDNDLVEKGFNHVNKAIEEDLSRISKEEVTKVLRVIHFVAKRRSKGGREYLKVINEYVGIRVARGVRALVLK